VVVEFVTPFRARTLERPTTLTRCATCSPAAPNGPAASPPRLGHRLRQDRFCAAEHEPVSAHREAVRRARSHHRRRRRRARALQQRAAGLAGFFRRPAGQCDPPHVTLLPPTEVDDTAMAQSRPTSPRWHAGTRRSSCTCAAPARSGRVSCRVRGAGRGHRRLRAARDLDPLRPAGARLSFTTTRTSRGPPVADALLDEAFESCRLRRPLSRRGFRPLRARSRCGLARAPAVLLRRSDRGGPDRGDSRACLAARPAPDRLRSGATAARARSPAVDRAAAQSSNTSTSVATSTRCDHLLSFLSFLPLAVVGFAVLGLLAGSGPTWSATCLPRSATTCRPRR